MLEKLLFQNGNLILKQAYEETSKVKMSRVQIFTSKFEALQMVDDRITKFSVHVHYIANRSFTLREKMSDSKLVRKVMRFPPQRFHVKVTSIEEAKDISNMKLN